MATPIGIGFALTAIKDDATKRETLQGGVEKVTLTKKTNPAARVAGAIFSFLITEIMDHEEEIVTYVFKDYNLGGNRNSAAEEANKQGNKYWNENNFSEAKQWYDAAYYLCETGYSNEQKFSQNGGNAEAEDCFIKGKNYLSNKDYENANIYFKKAYDKTQYDNRRSIFKEKLDEAESYIFNQEGNELYEKGKYEESISCYEKALAKFSNAVFKWKKENAQAESYFKQGETCFANKDYNNAKIYFNKADETTHLSNRKSYFKDQREKADAYILNLEGDTLYKEGKYEASISCYEKALAKFSNAVFKWKKENAQAESYFKQGETYFANKDYNNAKINFNKAHETTHHSNRKTYFKDRREKADAYILNLEGDKLYGEGMYEDSISCYEKAYAKLNDDFFKSNKENAQAEIYFKQGETYFANKDYNNAKMYFNKAYETAHLSNRKSYFKVEIEKADERDQEVKILQINYEAKKLLQEGQLEQQMSSIESAITKYEESAKKCIESLEIKPTDEVFDSLALVIEELAKIGAFHEANIYTENAKKFFPDKMEMLNSIIENIENNDWAPSNFKNNDNYEKHEIILVQQLI